MPFLRNAWYVTAWDDEQVWPDGVLEQVGLKTATGVDAIIHGVMNLGDVAQPG